MYVLSLCFVFFFVVGTAGGVAVNGDCSKDACDDGLTCVNNKCTILVHQQCKDRSECPPNADCVEVINGSSKVLLCQCKAPYTWDVNDRACRTAGGVAVNGDCSKDACDDGLTCVNDKCTILVHQQCKDRSECPPDADCVEVINGGNKVLLCQCKTPYTWDVNDRACNTAQGLAASLLLVASIFVTSRLL